MKKLVIALGGNAILSSREEATYINQYNNVEKTAKSLARFVKEGYKLVVAHGNGPQVGNLVLQNEIGDGQVPAMPLHVLTAQTQGFIGYMLEECLNNKLLDLGLNKEVTTVLTRIEVDREDEAFSDPTKPIGSFYTEEEARALSLEKEWIIKKDSNRGYRRVVYSPKPKDIVGIKTIEKLLDMGNLVIAAGGGGIPVYIENGQYKGVEAVIDKDFSTCKLAEKIDADIFMILTDVENVYLNYGEENQLRLEEVTVEQLEKYIEEGHFAKGSMLPKVEACINFAKLGKEAYICSLDNAKEALEGKSGTKISL